jgi:hypothetical protein
MSSLTSVKLTSYLCCCVLMTDEREGREAMLERLILAISDMADTAAAARFLLGPHSGIADFPWHAHRALETGMFSSYARAFNESKGDPPLPAAPTSSLSRRERETHKWALDERQKVWAHVDRAEPDTGGVPKPSKAHQLHSLRSGSHRRQINLRRRVHSPKSSMCDTASRPRKCGANSKSDRVRSCGAYPGATSTQGTRRLAGVFESVCAFPQPRVSRGFPPLMAWLRRFGGVDRARLPTAALVRWCHRFETGWRADPLRPATS